MRNHDVTARFGWSAVPFGPGGASFNNSLLRKAESFQQPGSAGGADLGYSNDGVTSGNDVDNARQTDRLGRETTSSVGLSVSTRPGSSHTAWPEGGGDRTRSVDSVHGRRLGWLAKRETRSMAGKGESMKPGMFDRIDRAVKPLLWVCGIYVVCYLLPQAIKYAMSR